MNIAEHIVQVIMDTPLGEDPMHHLEMQDFLPWNTYATLVENLPPDTWYKTLAPDSKKGAGTRALMGLGDGSRPWCRDSAQKTWSEVVRALASDAVRAVIFVKFEEVLSQRFNMNLKQLLAMETAPLVRLSRDVEGFYLAPHCDKPSKVVTLQLYLPPDDTQSDLGTSFYKKGSGFGGFDQVRRMPFVPNFAYAFPMTKVGKPSWHGVERIGRIAYPRDSLVLGFHVHD